MTQNGNIITCDEALEVLCLSGISEQKLIMILNMARNSMTDKTSTLNREQFYVAVRLVQFRQNRVSVQNLTLTVPDDICLKPPYFRGISELEIEKKRLCEAHQSLLDGYSAEDIEQSSTRSSSDLTLKCEEMEREIDKLKKELQTTVEQLNAVTKDNYILRKGVSYPIDSSIPFGSRRVEKVGSGRKIL